MRHGAKLAVGFGAAVLVVVLGAVAAGALLADGPPEPPAVENEQFDPETALPATADAGGEIRLDSDASGERIIVDTAHNNDVTDRDLAPLVGALSTNGHEVRTYDGVRLLSLGDALSFADALVVVNPEQTFTHEELDAIRAFLDNGGRVLVVMDPDSRNALREAEGQLGESTLFAELGLTRNAGYLYNGNRSENNYVRVFARPADDGSPLVEDVDRVVFPGASPVAMAGGRVALSTTPDTRYSTTGATGRHPVVVHDDEVALVGDASFLHPENAYHADNEVLIGNLADFLLDGDRKKADLEESGSEGDQTGGDAGDADGNETSTETADG